MKEQKELGEKEDLVINVDHKRGWRIEQNTSIMSLLLAGREMLWKEEMCGWG